MRIQVATLNVWALPEPFAPDVLPRMAAIGDRLSELSADVVCFQEVWMSSARDTLLRKGQSAGYAHNGYLEDAIGGGGLLMMSRLPIIESHFEPFGLSGYPEQLDNGEFFSGKGFAHVRIQGPDGPFAVLNTHLHARYSNRVSHQFAPHRIGQIIQLASRVKEYDEPVVMMGDFNMLDEDPEYRVLTGLTGMRDCAVEMEHRCETVMYSNPYRARKPISVETGRRIDYVFMRDGQTSGLQARSFDRVFDGVFTIGGQPASYSNHAGLMATIEMLPVHADFRHALNQSVVELASRLLSEGREEAERRRAGSRVMSGVGMACAVAAAAAGRTEKVNRRRFLQNTFRAAALVSLAPGVAYSVMSEFIVPNELTAFDHAEKSLDRLAQQRSSSSGALNS